MFRNRRPALFATLVTAALAAHDGPVKVPDAEAHRPNPLPDRINLTWVSDPATSQAVTWRTSKEVKTGFAEFALTAPDSSFKKKAVRLTAESSDLETDLGPARYHSVKLEKLSPATKYLYRVGDGKNWSEWFQFQTAKAEFEPFSFIYFGDAQNDLQEHWSRVIREAFIEAPRTKFILHAGDLVNNGNADAEWGEWFRAGGWITGMIPSMPVTGNHEYPKDPSDEKKRSLSRNWRPTFTLPTNGPAGLEETCYFIDYQGVRFVALNSNEQHEVQADWLDKTLTNNPNRWTVLSFHHPVYSPAKGRFNESVVKHWKPVIDRHKPDLVLNGHDHTYARTGMDTREINLPNGTTMRSEETGTVYVTSVSGPKMYDITKPRAPVFVRMAEDTQLYQVIRMEADRIVYRAWTASGDLYDGFSLKKRPGKVNEIVEEGPGTPERLRPAKAEDARKTAAE